MVRMRVTEDIPAMSAMVAAFEEPEGFVAGCAIADASICVEFPVRTRGRAGGFGEVI